MRNGRKVVRKKSKMSFEKSSALKAKVAAEIAKLKILAPAEIYTVPDSVLHGMYGKKGPSFEAGVQVYGLRIVVFQMSEKPSDFSYCLFVPPEAKADKQWIVWGEKTEADGEPLRKLLITGVSYLMQSSYRG
jgi:hypothetical protein